MERTKKYYTGKEQWRKPKAYFALLFIGLLTLFSFFIYFNFKEAKAPATSLENQLKNEQTNFTRKDFDQHLEEDIKGYLNSKLSSKDIGIKVELLREGPTITGLASPKFYIWVTLGEEDLPLGSGAMRVAEIEQGEFEVTDYLTLEEIKSNPDQLDEIFPNDVVKKIQEKIKVSD